MSHHLISRRNRHDGITVDLVMYANVLKSLIINTSRSWKNELHYIDGVSATFRDNTAECIQMLNNIQTMQAEYF